MHLTEEVRQFSSFIQAYKPGELHCMGQRFKTSVFLYEDNIYPWSISAAESIAIDTLPGFTRSKPDVFLVGTGEKHVFLLAAQQLPFLKQHIGLEVMDSYAACKTYNILMSEGRNVAAAILIA